MNKITLMIMVFSLLSMLIYPISDNPKTIQYEKKFTLKEKGQVTFRWHKQLFLYRDSGILEDVLLIESVSSKSRTHRIIRYKNNQFDRPISAEVKCFLKGNLISESKLIFQKKTYSFTSTQYYTEYKKLNPPKKMSREKFTISKNALYFNHTMETIGVRMIKKEKKTVACVQFPGRPLIFGDILDYEDDAVLTKKFDVKSKLTTYKILAKRRLPGFRTVLVLNRKSNKIIYYRPYGSKRVELSD